MRLLQKWLLYLLITLGCARVSYRSNPSRTARLAENPVYVRRVR